MPTDRKSFTRKTHLTSKYAEFDIAAYKGFNQSISSADLGSYQYLSCILDLLAGDVIDVESLEAWHVVKNVGLIVTKETHRVWG